MKSCPTDKIAEAARELLKACGYCVDNLWHVDDINFICEQLQLLPLSDEEAMEVFSIANDQFEGETGLSWPKLEEALQVFLQRRESLTAILERISKTYSS